MNLIYRIITESMSGDTGLFSSKKLTMFASFAVCVLMALVDQFTQYKLNQEAFNVFMLMSGSTGVLSVVDKKINDSPPSNEPETKQEVK